MPLVASRTCSTTAFRKAKVEWGYMMDDDVICEPTAVEELVKAYEHNFTAPEQVGFLVSQAVDGQGRANNVPHIDTRPKPRRRMSGLGPVSRPRHRLGARLTDERDADAAHDVRGLRQPQLRVRDLGRGPGVHDAHHRSAPWADRRVAARWCICARKRATSRSSSRTTRSACRTSTTCTATSCSCGASTWASTHTVNGIVRFLLDTTKLVAHGDLCKAQIALRGTMAGIVFNPKTPWPEGKSPAAAE